MFSQEMLTFLGQYGIAGLMVIVVFMFAMMQRASAKAQAEFNESMLAVLQSQIETNEKLSSAIADLRGCIQYNLMCPIYKDLLMKDKDGTGTDRRH